MMKSTLLKHGNRFSFSRLAWTSYLIIMMLTRPVQLFATLQRQRWYSRMLHEWLDELATKMPGAWLELGCGPGVFSAELAQKGIKMTAIDRSSGMIRFAKRHFGAHANLDFQLGNAHQLGLVERSFDVVLAASLINVVDDPQSVIKEMIRLCRHNGVIAVLLPSPDMNSQNAEKYINKFRLKGFDAAALRLWSSRAGKLSQHQLLQLFQAGGAENIRIALGLEGMVFYVYGIR